MPRYVDLSVRWKPRSKLTLPYYRPAAFARLIGVSRAAIHCMVAKGRLRADRLGDGLIVIAKSELARIQAVREGRSKVSTDTIPPAVPISKFWRLSSFARRAGISRTAMYLIIPRDSIDVARLECGLTVIEGRQFARMQGIRAARLEIIGRRLVKWKQRGRNP